MVDFGNPLANVGRSGCQPYGPLNKHKLSKAADSVTIRESILRGPDSDGEDSEIEIEYRIDPDKFRSAKGRRIRISKDEQVKQIQSKKEMLQDELDKAGPRHKHCVQAMIHDKYLKEIDVVGDPAQFWNLVRDNKSLKVYLRFGGNQPDQQMHHHQSQPLNGKQMIRLYKSRIQGIIEEWVKDQSEVNEQQSAEEN